jgi:hypothetical protein
MLALTTTLGESYILLHPHLVLAQAVKERCSLKEVTKI